MSRRALAATPIASERVDTPDPQAEPTDKRPA